MLYYRLTFAAGAEIVKLHTIKNFKIGAHITSVLRRNFKRHTESFTVIIYDEKSGKFVHDTDIICDGCTYVIIIIRRSRRSVTSSSPKKKYYKKYWMR